MKKSRLLSFAFAGVCVCACLVFLRSTPPDLEISVRPTPQLLVSTGLGDEEATELWLLDKKTGHSELLVRGRTDPDLTKTIATIWAPVFSPDHKTIYFLSSAWTTSGSLQAVDIATKKVRFLIDGNELWLITKGPHTGMLLVKRHLIKLDAQGETLGRDAYAWIVSPEGKPIREIGLLNSPASQEFLKLYTN